MGLDARIFKVKSIKQLTSESVDWSQIDEVWYARKFWGLQEHMSFLQQYECGDYIPLTLENVEEMLTYATHHRDFFDGFHTVPQLCEVIDQWEDAEEEGYKFVYEADW